MFSDLVRVFDRGVVQLRTRAGEFVSGRSWDGVDASVVHVEGWVKLCMREGGKIVPGSHREGKNIWTNTGREFLALLMSLQSPGTKFREDSVAYIGVGTGSHVEDASVTALGNPVAYTSGLFLASLDVPPTFPLTPTRTTVAYHRVFADNEITLSPGSTVDISEIGLFTNGDPAQNNAPGTRQTDLAHASLQAPVAYKTFEPVGKTSSLELEVTWEIRF